MYEAIVLLAAASLATVVVLLLRNSVRSGSRRRRRSALLGARPPDWGEMRAHDFGAMAGLAANAISLQQELETGESLVGDRLDAVGRFESLLTGLAPLERDSLARRGIDPATVIDEIHAALETGTPDNELLALDSVLTRFLRNLSTPERAAYRA